MSDFATNIWDELPQWDGVGARQLERSPQAELGASLFEYQPGTLQVIPHWHYGSDEMLVVLRGDPILALQDGDRQLREGDVLVLPRGPSGVHQVRNESAGVVRVMIVSTNANPDVAEYPGTDAISVTDGKQSWFYRKGDAVPSPISD
jgi:uncharacterized cupin superfamily protein